MMYIETGRAGCGDLEHQLIFKFHTFGGLTLFLLGFDKKKNKKNKRTE